ncbi:MAG: GGDEF domain-containing protein [Deltaproteobacteria bacterium]|nr:GGDEF domain-containing protein [Deltaproteobacteria bacterium]
MQQLHDSMMQDGSGSTPRNHALSDGVSPSGDAVAAPYPPETKRREWHRAWTMLQAMPCSLSFSIVGVALALLAPLGLLLARVGARVQPPTLAWVFSEVRLLLVVYTYVLLLALAVFVVIGYLLGRRFDRVHALSVTDPLTGLFNRRHFGKRLSEEILRGRRHGYSTCVLSLDVDRLKAINDGLGHKAGDNAIQVVGHVLSTNVRAIDVGARIGGDEFAVLLPETSRAQAEALAQRILTELAHYSDRLAEKLAISIGISEVGATSNMDADDVMASADEALYLAKTAGGGRAAFAQHNPHRTSLSSGQQVNGDEMIDRSRNVDMPNESSWNQEREAGDPWSEDAVREGLWNEYVITEITRFEDAVVEGSWNEQVITEITRFEDAMVEGSWSAALERPAEQNAWDGDDPATRSSPWKPVMTEVLWLDDALARWDRDGGRILPASASEVARPDDTRPDWPPPRSRPRFEAGLQ